MVKGTAKIMEILCSKLYETQLKEILKGMATQDVASAKNFKMYLDTLIINIPTKAKKYKQSIHLEEQNFRDLECEGYTVIFRTNAELNSFVLFSIIKKT